MLTTLMADEGDTFLPSILSVFYATFDPKHGPKIVYQVPEGLIVYNEPSDDEDEAQSTQSIISSVAVTPTDDAQPPLRSPTSKDGPIVVGVVEGEEKRPPLIATRHSNSSLKTKMHFSSPQKVIPVRSSSPSNEHPSNGTTSMEAEDEPGPSKPLFHFDDISKYVIPSSALCGRLVICTMRAYSIIGFPVALRGKQYKRNFFRYNICFVFHRTADLSCYEPIVRKIGRVLTACEVCSSYLFVPQWFRYLATGRIQFPFFRQYLPAYPRNTRAIV